MTPLLTYRGTVYPWHCDHMGHMNVMWYAGKFDEATWQLAGTLGLTGRTMKAAGTCMVAAEQVTKYFAELLAGDGITVHTRILEAGSRSIRFEHEMRNTATGEIAAMSTLAGVHIDRTTRRPCPLPESARSAIRALLDT